MGPVILPGSLLSHGPSSLPHTLQAFTVFLSISLSIFTESFDLKKTLAQRGFPAESSRMPARHLPVWVNKFLSHLTDMFLQRAAVNYNPFLLLCPSEYIRLTNSQQPVNGLPQLGPPSMAGSSQFLHYHISFMFSFEDRKAQEKTRT